MKSSNFISIAELAKLLGISRIAVYKKVKKGYIKAQKIGRSFAIPRKCVADIMGTKLKPSHKSIIAKAVKKTVREYGETLRLLGNE